MKKSILIFASILLVVNTVFAQDIIYTISGEYNQSKTPLDSIVIENITNGTSISFSNLPEHDYYQINLTKSAYWGTVSVFDIEEASNYVLLENSPGNLSIRFGGPNETDIKLSIININGQILYIRNDLVLNPNQNLHVKLGSESLYFVKIESSLETKTFKAFGIVQETAFAVSVGNGINTKSASSSTLKSTTIFGAGDFTFEEGDSIRIWGFRKEIYALPKHLKILKFDKINFKFETVYYSKNMEMAYPDSVGVDSNFLIDNDTIFCKKINGEYIFQGDIILTEKQLGIAPTKGASTSDLTKLWTDGIVYYKINNSFTDKVRVIDAVFQYQNSTPLTFKNIDDLSGSDITNYIEFVSTKNKNNSYLGMIGGRQTINIGATATSGTIIHEIGHAVGLIHEHSRTDRDNYITLNWYNINSNFPFHYNDFRKLYRSKCMGNLDFNSVMIYSSVVHTNSGKEVLVITKLDGSKYEAQRSYLSKGDVKIIEELYGSISKKKPVVSTIRPSNPTISSMKLTGFISFDGGKSITARGFGWCKAGETVYKIENVNGTTGKFEFTLNTLKPNTEYWIYAFAANSNGTAIGDLVSFKTLEDKNPWTYKAPMRYGAYYFDAVEIEGKIYAVGIGSDYKNQTPKIEVYDPITDSWNLETTFPEFIYSSGAVALNNKIYIFGGEIHTSVSPWIFAVGTVLVYDVKNKVWDKKTQMPTMRSRPRCVTLNGKIYVIGGSSGGGCPSYKNFEVYDPDSDSWEIKSPMPTARQDMSCVYINGKIYVMYGEDHKNCYPFLYNSFEIYDVATQTWSRDESSKLYRKYLGASVVDNKIYLIGGYGSYDPKNYWDYLDFVDIYDPASKSWTAKTSMPIRNYGFAQVVCNNKIYLLGGPEAKEDKDVLEYDPSKDK